MGERESVYVRGHRVDRVSIEHVRAFVDDAVGEQGRARTILAMNPEKVMALDADSSLADIFERADILLPDGIGLVLAARVLSGLSMRRLAGADVMQLLCEHAARNGYSIFLYGSSEAVSEKAAGVLVERYTDLNIAGRHHGHHGPEEDEAIVAAINTASPDLLFVALGSPKQERWVQRYRDHLNVSVIQCIGGTLDTLAGRVRRAPVLFRKLGLEWLYRLMAQPSRVLRQTALPRFVWAVVRERVRGQTNRGTRS